MLPLYTKCFEIQIHKKKKPCIIIFIQNIIKIEKEKFHRNFTKNLCYTSIFKRIWIRKFILWDLPLVWKILRQFWSIGFLQQKKPLYIQTSCSHFFSFLCFVCLRPVSCVSNVVLCVFHTWLTLRFSLTFISLLVFVIVFRTPQKSLKVYRLISVLCIPQTLL
jgi:hypothetical protein